MPEWGFGNRILYYNNLRQLSKTKQKQWSCSPWLGYKYFTGDLLNGAQRGDEKLEPCLGDKFFEWNSISTREIFKLKETTSVNESTCAVHFRGTDFHHWNPNSILSANYYIKSIDMIKDSVKHFVLFTDDETLASFSQVRTKLKNENIIFSEGQNTCNRQNYIKDFSYMSECDWIISSPSTFCICAGFVGKKKKIIHSKNWVEDRASRNEQFWVDLLNGGNEDYSMWGLV